MTKRNKIIYWIATVWLALGMTSTGIVQLARTKAEVDKTSLTLGYPGYLLTILGIWKLSGVFAVLVPNYPLLKEWAYAGFLFVMSGAIFSHVAVGNNASQCAGPAILLLPTIVSWYYTPADRTLKTFKPKTDDESTSELVF